MDDAKDSRARALGLLWTAGASLTLVWLAVGQARTGLPLAVTVADAVLALGWGAAMLVGLFDRWGQAYLHVAIAVIHVVIAFSYVMAADPRDDIRLFFVWTAPYAALFFGRRAAIAHLAWAGLLLATALAVLGAETREAAAIWLMTFGTACATGLLVGWSASLARRTHARVQYLADHDPLTDLPNRRMFGRLLDQALADPEVTVGVLLIDLDSFKVVNDSHGHDAGDRLLRQVAPRLAARLGRSDVLARLGGDEFAVLHRAPAGTDATTAATALAARLGTAWDDPFDVAGGIWTCGCIGVAVSDRAGSDAGALVREADAALYRAKAAGRGAVRHYDEGLRRAARRQLRLESELRGAAARGELSVAYQPVVLQENGEVIGVEALCRWDSPRLGVVDPDEFVPIAEESGLIREVGGFVLGEAVAAVAAWRRAGVVDSGFTMAVNVSPQQLHGGLAGQVQGLLDAQRWPAGERPSALAFELTEAAIADDSADTTAELARLRAAGHVLHVDDFGNGYSALARLVELPVAAVKIDRALVSALVADPRREAVVHAVLRLAETLALRVVAEGVETAEQALRLRALGCRCGQGMYFGGPLAEREIVPLLRRLAPRGRELAGAGVPVHVPARR